MDSHPGTEQAASPSKAQILPGTGRWRAEGVTEGSHLSASAALGGEAGPLHHPADGPPPRAGEDFSQLAPTRHRDDGWTAERQRAFLEALAACGSVSEAARSVGMSRESAYALRRRSDARPFVQAWDAARALAVEHLTEVAWDRALHGQLRPVYYHGEQVGEVRHYDNRLLLALIAQNRVAAGAALPSSELVSLVAQDWGGALARIESGEALDEPAPVRPDPARPEPGIVAPLDPETDAWGNALSEAQQLGIGSYGHWWDEEREEWLTNWPAPADFDGEELWIDEDDVVLGPYDPDEADSEDAFGRPIKRGYARTLSAAELEGLERQDEAEETHRLERIELYRRARFGLASAAERASIIAANDGAWQFAGPPASAAAARISGA